MVQDAGASSRDSDRAAAVREGSLHSQEAAARLGLLSPLQPQGDAAQPAVRGITPLPGGRDGQRAAGRTSPGSSSLGSPPPLTPGIFPGKV